MGCRSIKLSLVKNIINSFEIGLQTNKTHEEEEEEEQNQDQEQEQDQEEVQGLVRDRKQR